jgi:hypothetical protein
MNAGALLPPTSDGSDERHVGSESAEEEGDPPDPIPQAANVIPCTVWFGPQVPRFVERELMSFLGSHNGIAVLQWPRDVERATRCADLGIPRLWFVQCQTEPPVPECELEEWLPSGASDELIHGALCNLGMAAATRRRTAPAVLDDDYLLLGSSRVHLGTKARDLAAELITHFDQPVEDSLLSRICEPPTAMHRSLFSDLLHLDQDVNQLGLEIVAVRDHAHLIRRCSQ